MSEQMQVLPYVSIVVPIKNEERYLPQFMECIEKQTYDKTRMEVIFSDGKSTDATSEIIHSYMDNSKLVIKYMVNENENAPSGVNVGIKAASGEVILRMDAHTIYDHKYVEWNVHYLINGYGDNVGCPIETRGEGTIGKAIAYVLSSKFGVGNSNFRVSKGGGYVDTVPFGCFYKALIDKIGYFDETLPRAEDNDFNHRIREKGGRIYMFGEIQSIYYSRDSIDKLVRMGFANGSGIADLMRKEKRAVGIRHLIPFAFLCMNVVGVVLAVCQVPILPLLYAIAMCFYGVLDLLFSIKSIKEQSVCSAALCVILYPIFHLSYGFGTLVGIIRKSK